MSVWYFFAISFIAIVFQTFRRGWSLKWPSVRTSVRPSILIFSFSKLLSSSLSVLSLSWRNSFFLLSELFAPRHLFESSLFSSFFSFSFFQSFSPIPTSVKLTLANWRHLSLSLTDELINKASGKIKSVRQKDIKGYSREFEY